MFLRFISQITATIIGLFLFTFLAIITLVGIAVAGSNTETIKPVHGNTVITLDINEIAQDYSGQFNYSGFDFDEDDKDGFIDVLNGLEKAKTDANIKGISILNSNISLGLAQSKSLRDKLKEFKETGKFIVAYADSFTQKNYYLNSVADTIYLNPIGEMELKGLAAEILYFKKFQEKSGLKMEIIRHGKYKSAVEPFLSDTMSPENKEQISAIINSAWNTIASDIATSRNISIESINAIANELKAQTPEQALQLKLIDKIDYEDVYHNGIKKALGLDKNKDYPTINILDYNKTPSLKMESENTIAVVYAQGIIWGGEGSDTQVGEQSIKRALGDIRKNEDIKAVVLRVDSPGGSALVSELIWREIELTKKVKPVIVSMGNTAASGGYYIACGANRIFAEPTTITGSIGVFGQIPNFSQVTEDMGINTQIVKTHENAPSYSPFRPLDESFKNTLTQSIENIYTTFLNRVSKGRNLSIEEVDKIAQGRVWIGTDALKAGLIDEIGGLDKAIAYAAQQTQTTDFKVKNYPEYKVDFEHFINDQLGISVFKSTESLLETELGTENYLLLQQIKEMNSRKGLQTVMPYQLNIN
ncbi:MAG: signal peptide peptidase SppA [Flavobacteriales bacterium]|nr:signal peptide peptidase SppA [Flavobacteriales bacterium]